MRLVADENCDFSLVTDLRAAGYDVVAISEQMAGADDQRVIDFARSERRLLLTATERVSTAVLLFLNQGALESLGS
jgi:predicted nuclease of predicted toxin-antitoxin system